MRNVRSKPDSSFSWLPIGPETDHDHDDDTVTLRCREIIRENERTYRMKETYFKNIHKSTTMNNVFAVYTQMRQSQQSSLLSSSLNNHDSRRRSCFRFMYRGQEINGNQTPLTLEMNEKVATIKVSLLEKPQMSVG